MLLESDIDRAARLMITSHGDMAAQVADRRASDLRPRELPAAETWDRIAAAIRAIQNEAITAIG